MPIVLQCMTKKINSDVDKCREDINSIMRKLLHIQGQVSVRPNYTNHGKAWNFQRDKKHGFHVFSNQSILQVSGNVLEEVRMAVLS